MLCERCHKKPATAHIETVVNGQAFKAFYCDACAAEVGLASASGLDFLKAIPLPDPSPLFTQFLSFLSDWTPQIKPGESGPCPACGWTLDSLQRSGRMGCPGCYRHFAQQTKTLLRRIHGSSSYRGKIPVREPAPAVRPREELDDLRRKLAQALRHEHYEDAAVLRDRIRRAEEGGA